MQTSQRDNNKTSNTITASPKFNSVNNGNHIVNNSSLNYDEEKQLSFSPVKEPIKVFDYLSVGHQANFLFNPSEISENTPNVFSDYINKYILVICIIIENDSNESSTKLKMTLDSLAESLMGLSELNVAYSQMLLCCFIKEIRDDKNLIALFPQYNQHCDRLLKTDSFICSKILLGLENSQQLDLILSYKPQSTEIDILKNYYVHYIKHIAFQSNSSGNDVSNPIIYSSIVKSGMLVKSLALYKLMLTLENTKGICSVPSIETIHDDIFSTIQQYQLIHSQIYEMHYYNFTSSIPVSSLFNVFRIDAPNLLSIQTFYAQINSDASIHYHDYKLGLYLTEMRYPVCFVPDVQCSYNQSVLNLQQMMNNYCNQLSPLFITFPNLCYLFISICEINCLSILKKLGLVFQLIGIFFDFAFVSFASMFIYTILFEAFNIKDGRATVFCLVIYFFLLILAGFNSFISSKNKPATYLTLGLYVIIEVYYLLVIVCSVPAMHFVKLNKTNDRYQFDTPALGVLISVNFVFGIIPLLLNIKKVIRNVKGMLLYVVLGSPCYTSMFLIQAIFQTSDLYGTVQNCKMKPDEQLIESRKGLIIGLWGLTNLFFSYLIFFMVDRTSRVNCVLGLSIIFTIYNVVKMCIVFFDTVINTNRIDKIVMNHIGRDIIKERIAKQLGLSEKIDKGKVD